MNIQETTPSLPEPVSLAPCQPSVPRLSRTWLTVCLVSVTLIPAAIAATVWLAVPATPEPQLSAEVSFEPMVWPPTAATTGESATMMPAVHLHNPTDQLWRNVEMSINGQFYFYCPEPIPAQGDFRVPLAFFKTSGNQTYRPSGQRIKKLTIYAQLPSGGRAIRDLIEPEMLTATTSEQPAP